ncbi:MAG TPA: glycosyltransferase family 4 protein, partial [Gaiellaceae bacterium]
MTTVLALYPPTQAFRAELAERFGELDVVTIPELRRLGTRQVVARLRQMRGTVVLAVEGSASNAGLPALHAASALTRAARRVVLVRGSEPVEAGRRVALSSLAGALAASVEGTRALASTDLETRRLLTAERVTAAPKLDRGLVHLNVSPWLGLSSGGAVAHTVGVANALAEEGVGTTVATYTETPGLHPNVAYRRLPATRLALIPELNRFRLARAAQRIDLSPGVVYERLSLGSTAGVALSRKLGVPLVVEYNGSELWAARHWDGTRGFERTAERAETATLQHAHLVVTVSAALSHELEQRGVDPGRIVWHPNGVDAERFAPEHDDGTLRQRYGIPPDATLITFVGTFGAWHGAEVLARAARRVPAGVHVLFVGDGARRAAVAELLAGVANTTLAGTVPADEIPLHLAASDVLVAPHVPNPDGSPFFGSPTKLFEYMAAGRAIVASRLDQIADVLADDAAVLVPPGDEQALLEAIEMLAAQPARRRELGEHARARALARY